MIRIFMITNTRDYTRAAISAWLVNASQSLMDHPLAKLRRMALSLWNEEPGEISLSMLAQSNALHTNRTNIEQVSTLYTLLKHQRGLLQSIPGLDKQMYNKGQPIASTGADVQHAVSFYRQTIREIGSSTFTVYTDQPSSWKNKLLSDGTRKASLSLLWSRLGRLDCLNEHLEDLQRLLLGGSWHVEPDALEMDAVDNDSDGTWKSMS